MLWWSHSICKTAYFTKTRVNFGNQRPWSILNSGCTAFYIPPRIINATAEGSGTHTLQGFSSKTYTRQRYPQTAQQPIQVSGIRSRRHCWDAWSCWTNKVQKNFFNNLCSFNENIALGIKIQTWHLWLRRVTATRVEFTLLVVLSLGVQWGTVRWGERIPA